jgi:hypothetical protein
MFFYFLIESEYLADFNSPFLPTLNLSAVNTCSSIFFKSLVVYGVCFLIPASLVILSNPKAFCADLYNYKIFDMFLFVY